MNSETAKALLKYFKRARHVTADDGSWGKQLTGRFVSNPGEDMAIYGGFIRDEDTCEIHLYWEGIPGVEDMFPGSYVFHVDPVRNWQEAARAARAHLRDVIYSELFPLAGVLGTPVTSPDHLRGELKKRGLEQQAVAEKMGVPYRTMQNWMQDPWKDNYRQMPLERYRDFCKAVEELSA